MPMDQHNHVYPSFELADEFRAVNYIIVLNSDPKKRYPFSAIRQLP
jgi:hypothetical protein